MATRRNLATNPRAKGAGGFATTANIPNEVGTTTYLTGKTDGPVSVPDSYGRRSVTTQGIGGSGGWLATSSEYRPPVSGGAGDRVTVSIWLRYTGAGTISVALRALAYSSAGSNAGQNDAPLVALQSGVWTRLTSTVTATRDFATAGWWAYFFESITPMPDGSTLDATGLLVEKGATTGTYFDGDSEWTDSHRYRWEGVPNASVSVEDEIPQRITVTPVYGAGAPKAELTISELGFADSIVSLWRTADGERSEVRGYRRVRMIDTARVTDHDVPLGRPVTYELEVISGPDGPSRTTSKPVTVESDTAWIMDPLDPSTAVPVSRISLPDGSPGFAATALDKLNYTADSTIIRPAGTDRGMAQYTNRQAATGVSYTMITNATEQNKRLRNLLTSSALLLIRIPPGWADGIDGTNFTLISTIAEIPINSRLNKPLTIWEMQGDTVAAPVIKVLTATFTYGDVKMLFNTYQQKQDALAVGATYLDDSKAPFG